MIKKALLLILFIVSFFLFSCESNQKNPFEGNWELLHAEGTYGIGDEMVNINMKKDENNYGMKLIHDGYFMVLGQDMVTGELAPHYTYGMYTFKDNVYTEHIIFHVDKDSIGKSPSYQMIVKGDTLIQKGPLKIGEFKDITYEFTETYVRK